MRGVLELPKIKAWTPGPRVLPDCLNAAAGFSRNRSRHFRRLFRSRFSAGKPATAGRLSACPWLLSLPLHGNRCRGLSPQQVYETRAVEYRRQEGLLSASRPGHRFRPDRECRSQRQLRPGETQRHRGIRRIKSVYARLCRQQGMQEELLVLIRRSCRWLLFHRAGVRADQETQVVCRGRGTRSPGLACSHRGGRAFLLGYAGFIFRDADTRGRPAPLHAVAPNP